MSYLPLFLGLAIGFGWAALGTYFERRWERRYLAEHPMMLRVPR